MLVDRSGALEYVTVKPGLSAGGYVEVTAPGEGSSLANSWWSATRRPSRRERDEVGRAHLASCAD